MGGITGEFSLSGGLISNNTSGIHGVGGGGVYNGGVFCMLGGAIANNTSVWGYGGGVSNMGSFCMSGGAISDNLGGIGVYNFVGSAFTWVGGVVSGDTAPKK
ncbi:MAG: hypothetical protein LBI79_05510 [Nitrososphaerota archaeon]|nr:hypothetical protein [Nitrososphaerota archaeon]